MKLGFVFDSWFLKYDGHYYCTNLSVSLWNDRYLKVFDKIVVVGREINATKNPSNKNVRSDCDSVEFACIPNAHPLKRMFCLKKEYKFIEEQIKDCDFVVLRGWWGVEVCKKLNKPYMIEVVSCVWDSFWNHSCSGFDSYFHGIFPDCRTTYDLWTIWFSFSYSDLWNHHIFL